jgi:hypothetical protein
MVFKNFVPKQGLTDLEKGCEQRKVHRCIELASSSVASLAQIFIDERDGVRSK